MTAGGFAMAVSALQLAEIDAFYTIGAAFDVLPAVLFLHVYLAFPDGRLKSNVERALVAAAYASAVGLQLAKGGWAGSGRRTCSRSRRGRTRRGRWSRCSSSR